MITEYRIYKVVMKNYRQYYEEVVAEFTTKENALSIFLGENGEGKSNLLNAINWCLYHHEPHKGPTKDLPIINTKYLTEQPEDSKCEMRVDVYLDKDDTKYKISRNLVGIKHKFKKIEKNGVEFYSMIESEDDPVPVGLEIDQNMSNTSFLVTNENGTWEEDKTRTFEAQINHILPKSLSSFFILDGEFLEKLFEQTGGLVKNGIEPIAQIDIMRKALGHLKNSKIGTGKDGHDTELDKLDKELELITFNLQSKDKDGKDSFTSEKIWGETDKYYHNTGEPRRDDYKNASENIKGRLAILNHEIHVSGAVSQAELQTAVEILEQQIEVKNIELTDLLKDYYEYMIHEGPKILLKNTLEGTNQIIENNIQDGRLPTHVKKIFMEELLSKKHCFCGTLLEDGSQARINVERVKEETNKDENLDVAIEMKFQNKTFFDDYMKITNRFDEDLKKIISARLEIQRLSEERKTKRREIQSTGGSDYSRLVADAANLREELGTAEQEIGKLNKEISDETDKRKEVRRKMENLEIKNQKAKIKRHQFITTENVREKLQEIHDEVAETIRVRVGEKTTEFFKNIAWKENRFDKVTVDEDYRLKLFTTDGFNTVSDLSAGERLFLTLSFIAAIREITGYKFPLVIDTPLGKLSTEPRKLLAANLNKFFPNSQITLLATDTEYMNPNYDMKSEKLDKSFKDLLPMEKIEYRIKFDQNTATSSIQRRGE